MFTKHEDIVISGISGRYPESDNVNEFWENLISGRELVTIDDKRWPVAYLNLPPRQGKVRNIHKMDNEFFHVSTSDANYMDPQVRLLHETVYEAIVDAGIDPEKLRGSKTAVFIGLCYDDTDSAYREDPSKSPAFKQLASSRISHAFDFRGPVFSTDTACASSFSAFHKAVTTIRAGEADAVLVCGVAIHLRPFTAVAFHNLKMLSDDGRSKCMDSGADGYCRSEAVVTVFLQKKTDAKRIYATVLNTRTNTDGYKQEGITFPSYKAQKTLMDETYSEVGVDPSTLSYMEAHMTGTPAGDPVESQAIVDVCCPEGKKRDPLLMGCLKSNMGHTEGASGVCAISKACLAFQRRELPPNLHLNTPNPNIEGLKTGVLKPVLERMPFNGNLIGVNSFGFGGCNVHAILKANEKFMTDESMNITSNGIPRLITGCGRTRDAVDFIFEWIEKNPKDVTKGFLTLLDDVSKSSPESGMWIRGYGLLKDQKIVASKTNRIREKKPLWFVFSALGCQWPAMAKSLMPVKVFSDSIRKSSQIIKPLGYDLDQLLLDPSQKLESLIETFLSIVSIQIALVDLLYYLDMRPDGIVGHSVGEIAAGYADDCMTHEQTILTAYTIAKIAVEKQEKRGAMGAIGLSWEQTEARIPEDSTNLFIGCNNAQDSVTLSGYEDDVKKLLKELDAEGIFAKEVDSCGIPFHSPLVKNTYQPITDELKKILTSPKQRSYRWLSTSVPQERWHEEEFRVLGPTYYPNSMISPVKFGDVFQYIPKDAVVVEVGPHAMLLSLIKRGLGPDATCIPILKRDNNEKNLEMMLSSIGQIYYNGHNPSIHKLYPREEYPVPRETASLSPLIQWDHSKDLEVTKFPDYFNVMKGEQLCSFDLMDQTHQFLMGHCIDGRVLFPATGYLWIIWQRLAISSGLQSYEGCAVEFLNVKFHRATMLPRAGNTTFKVIIMPHNGRFSIIEGGAVCVSGEIKIPNDHSTEWLENLIQPKVNGALPLAPKEIYKEFRVRGYDYGPTFQGLVEASSDGCRGKIKWTGNWISFTDSILQLAILGKKERGLFLPTFIEYMKCDIKTLMNEIKNCKNDLGESVMEAKFDKDVNAGFCKGIVIKGLKATAAPRRQNQKATIESYQFLPYHEVSDEFLSQSEQQKLKKYSESCNQLIQVLKSESFDDVKIDESLKITLESPDDKYSLIKTLDKVLQQYLPKKDVKQKDEATLKKEEVKQDEPSPPKPEKKPIDLLKDELISSSSLLCEDQLITSPLKSERLIRPQIDVILENHCSKKITITEVNESDAVLCDDISDMIEAGSIGISINYSLLHADPESMSKYGVEASLLKNHLPNNSEADVIIYKDASTSFINRVIEKPKSGESTEKFELNVFLKSSYQNMKTGSFVLFVFRSKRTVIEEQIISMYPDLNGTHIPKLKNEQYFASLAQEAGFIIVSSKTDQSFGCHTILVRKPVDTTVEQSADDKPVLIEVKINDYSWVNELKEHLVVKNDTPAEAVVTEPTDVTSDETVATTTDVIKKKYKVWLVAKDSSSSGIIGLVNCLRREPGGDRVRCIFCPPEENKNGSNLLKDDIVKKDLVMNVFREGSFGSFRHFLVENIEEETQAEHSYVDVKTKGDLSSLRWFEVDHKYWLSLPENSKFRNTSEVLVNVFSAAINFKDVMVATGRIPMDAYPSDHMGTGLIGMEFAGVDHTGKRVMGFTMSKGIATTIMIADRHFLWDFPDSWSMAQASTVPVIYLTVYYALNVRAKMRDGESILIHAGTGGVGQGAIHVCLNRGCKVFTTVGSEAKREFLKKTFPQLKDEHIGNSRDCSFEEMVFRETNGRGVDIVLNSLAEDKFKASVRCLAEGGRFIEIGKYDIVQNHELDLSDIGANKTFNAVCVAHLDYEAVVLRTPGALRMSHEIRRYVSEGIIRGEVKPIATHEFEKDQLEEAFRFMATGKHMGKVLIKVRDGDGLTGIPDAYYVKAIKQTYFHPLKSFIVTGGLGGFGLELCQWLVTRGARHLVISSRNGIKTTFQHNAVKRFKEYGATVAVVNHDVATFAGAASLLQEAENLGPVGGVFHLAMVLKDALLENQTPETFDEACGCKVNGTINLDKITRAACPDLEFFVCFSSVTSGRGNMGQTNYGFANSVMERCCEMRKRDGLSGISIQWGAVGDVGVVAESMGGNDIIIGGTIPQRIPSCLEVLDQFLQSSLTVCSSIVKADKKRSSGGGRGDLLRQVCHILGVKDPNSLDPNTTLGDLGLDSLMAVEIRQALERDYDMVLSAQEVRQLKVKDIQAIGSKSSTSDKNKKDSSGAKGSSGDSSDGSLSIEFNPLSPLPQMFVKLNKSDNQSGTRPIFFIPSIENDLSILHQLASHVSRQVISLNWTDELASCNSLFDAAKIFVMKMKDLYPDTSYDIVGYGFGSLMALEIALQMQEAYGTSSITKLILMDGSPSYCRALNQLMVPSNNSSDDIESHVDFLTGFSYHHYVIETPIESVKAQLMKIKSKEERLKIMSGHISKSINPDVPIDCDKLQKAVDLFSQKIRMSEMYEPEVKLSSHLMLCRASTAGITNKKSVSIEQDYGMSILVKGGCEVRIYGGDHKTFLTSNIDHLANTIDTYFQYLTFA